MATELTDTRQPQVQRINLEAEYGITLALQATVRWFDEIGRSNSLLCPRQITISLSQYILYRLH